MGSVVSDFHEPRWSTYSRGRDAGGRPSCASDLSECELDCIGTGQKPYRHEAASPRRDVSPLTSNRSTSCSGHARESADSQTSSPTAVRG